MPDGEQPADAAPSDGPRAIDGAAATPVIAAVQEVANSSTAPGNSLVFPQQVQAGDSIIVCFTFPSHMMLGSIDDSLANQYTAVVGPALANGYNHYIAIASSPAAGSDTVTVTLSGPVSAGWELLALEYTGLAPTDPFDASAYASGSDGSAMSSGSASTKSAHELLLAYGHSSGPMAGSGYTARDSTDESLVEDHVVFATGSYTATATTSPGIWTLLLATFAGR
jgi:hypothetical protein